jgi:glycosyltransferase involved in cell wall biosynthesis
METKKLISIITPVYNEEDSIDHYYQRVVKTINKLSNIYDFEIIFTDNCSTDKTFDKLKNLCTKDSRIKAFKFSKNFGYQKSIWFGYYQSKGDVTLELDVDLQDPPEMLEEMLKYWNKGFKIVYGIRKDRKEGYIIKSLRKIFYRIVRKISYYDIPNDAGDFMLIDKDVVDHLKKIKLSDPYLRGTIFGFGYSKIGIEYKRDAREAGVSKFPSLNLIKLAIDGLVNTSVFPLRLASIVGIVSATISIVLFFIFIIDKIFLNSELPRGTTSILLLLLTSIAINSILIGILGEYIGKIYRQLSCSDIVPIVEEKINNDKIL